MSQNSGMSSIKEKAISFLQFLLTKELWDLGQPIPENVTNEKGVL